ncbi:hypothetical protein CDD82_719 [Ophiocordyceps australis]|uniref:Cenp-O kinetochore centromere component n=1 Tax=Ophiocordyceps australis TaxID=1399860 RepID=A0A2C5YFD7_9HYPO|nr:hypothetical protein CDD82_719 [Ophiocordyceps australis]
MSTTADDDESQRLDREIDSLRAQVTLLQKELDMQCSTILSSHTTQSAIAQDSIPTSPHLFVPQEAQQDHESWAQARLAARAEQQRAYMQQCAFRSAIPVTAFKVQDPDPNAVDGGHVLGLRFEVMSRGQFLRPYYVMLNRPFSHAPRHLSVHRHTLPPAVPLAGLAARHLPPPQPYSRRFHDGQDDSPPPQNQNLDAFARALRREVMRYHNRLGVAADLRRSLGLHDAVAAADKLSPNSVVELGIADIEAKQIKLTWADERTGRLVMDDNGNVLNLAIFGPQGRDWQTASELYGAYDNMNDVARRIQEQHNAVGL